MALRDEKRGDWVSDVKAILNVNQKVAYDLHSFLCNIVCHRILEQVIEDPTTKEFRIPLAPIGDVTLCLDDAGEWYVKDICVGNSFDKAAKETLRCKESRLYRDLYDRAYNQLTKNLKRFAAENLQ